MPSLIPIPSSYEATTGTFQLTPEAVVRVPPGTPELLHVGRYLAGCLKPATGYDLPVIASAEPAGPGSLVLTTDGARSALGAESYELCVEPGRVTLTGSGPEGLFRGVQTLRQLLPTAIEASNRQPGPWTIDCCTVRDASRFPWRGMMLDVARHFFTVEEVERLIDQMAFYKLNVLHLHLTDDQGWRLAIDSWPRLAEVGGSTATHGDRGGYYSKEDYRSLIAYAAERFVTVVPEVDMPSHTHAALASYPELKGTTKFSGPYTGTKVGFSSLAIDEEITYKFIEQVVAEIAALTPGPYFHIGGDEAHSTPEADYVRFIERAQDIVRTAGKQPMGWEEIAKGKLLPGAVVQYWWQEPLARKAAQAGNKLLVSPASNAYIDIKYDRKTRLGQDWTKKYIEVRDGYDWDPASILDGVTEDSILGVETPLWTETIVTPDDLDFMTFPRLPGYAEIGWTPQAKRSWDDYRMRLAAHGPRMQAMGINFYRSPQVEWE